MPRPIIIYVQPEQAVQFLAVVLVRLVGVLDTFTEQPAEGIIVVHLQYSAGLVHNHPVVSLMILQIVMVRWCSAPRESHITLLSENHTQRAVFVYLTSYILSLCNVVA